MQRFIGTSRLTSGMSCGAKEALPLLFSLAKGVSLSTRQLHPIVRRQRALALGRSDADGN